jgi:hypothetical protein
MITPQSRVSDWIAQLRHAVNPAPFAMPFDQDYVLKIGRRIIAEYKSDRIAEMQWADDGGPCLG